MAKRKSARGKPVAVRKPAVKQVLARRSRPAPASNIASPANLYSVHPGVAMVQKWRVELQGKTGRSLEEWTAHIKAAGPKDEKSSRLWLKEKYAIGTNTAWWLAEKAFARPLGLADDDPQSYLAACPAYVERMYAGPRALLRPIHDEIIRLARQLGGDVKICPCKTIVPLYRRHVFAEIKPATNKRIDLGLALGEEPFTNRLADTRGLAKKNRITHKVAILAADDLDLQVKRWLKQAYERDA